VILPFGGFSVDQDRYGLSQKEREHLAGQAHPEQHMDVRTSLLAFASLLLICALIIAASVIAGLHGTSEVPNTGSTRVRQPVESTSHAERNRPASEARAETDTQSFHEFAPTNSPE
jgi:hypothetical protein